MNMDGFFDEDETMEINDICHYIILSINTQVPQEHSHTQKRTCEGLYIDIKLLEPFLLMHWLLMSPGCQQPYY